MVANLSTEIIIIAINRIAIPAATAAAAPLDPDGELLASSDLVASKLPIH